MSIGTVSASRPRLPRLPHNPFKRDDLRASRSLVRGLCEDENVLVDVLKEEIRRVRIATKDRPLLAPGTPFPSCAILAPYDLVDHNEANLTQEPCDIGSKREAKKTEVGMLVDVRRHYA